MTLEEGGVVTTCELATWEPEVVDDIPIARDSIVVKIIMKVSCICDLLENTMTVTD